MEKTIHMATAALLLVAAIATVGLGGKSITIKGSDTMVILGQRWAETDMKQNPGTVIQVTGAAYCDLLAHRSPAAGMACPSAH